MIIIDINWKSLHVWSMNAITSTIQMWCALHAIVLAFGSKLNGIIINVEKLIRVWKFENVVCNLPVTPTLIPLTSNAD